MAMRKRGMVILYLLKVENIVSDEKKPDGASLYRGPSGPKRDKRERAQDRPHVQSNDRPAHDRAAPNARHHNAPHTSPRIEKPRREYQARSDAASDAFEESQATARAPRELRLYGVNACLASFAKRPEALRKVYLLEARIPQFKAVLAFCVQHKLGYRVVEEQDLAKLTSSAHHEGICFDLLPNEEQNLSHWLQQLPQGPCVAIWLDGIGNPHNLGAILRSAAHFDVSAILLPKQDTIGLSGAAARVAEGGAEYVPLVRLGRSENAIAQLTSTGFQLAATVVRGGQSLYKVTLPERLVLVMGAEQMGVDKQLSDIANFQLGIPGSGKVESLNVSAATAVVLSEWKRQHRP
jgi:RNA methyltransferase, TrmH family